MNHRSIFGFSVIDDEQIFLSSFEFEVKVDQAFTFNQTTSVSDRFNFLYFCFSAHDQAEERTLVQSTPLETSLPATINYATSTDLLALERKLEVLVAEATTTISSRLLTHIANPTTVSDETALTPEANSPEGGLPNLVASTSTGPRDPTVTPMKRRRGKTPAKVRVNKSPSSPPED